MSDLVLDASVIVKWFRSAGEADLRAARELRAAFERGELVVLAPPIVHLELVNVAGRRWKWNEARLTAFARALAQLGIQLVEPELDRVARWTARGLTAYDAAYVALAEAAAVPVITADELVLATAPAIARPLGRPSDE